MTQMRVLKILGILKYNKININIQNKIHSIITEVHKTYLVLIMNYS